MPDFELQPQATASFASLPWTDPPSATKPSRVTDLLARRRFAWTARINEPFEVWAKPNGGAAGDPDSALGGRLFTAWFAESPTPASPTYPLGYTSRIACVMPLPGHCVLVVSRPDGGRVALHLDVVDPNLPAPP